MVLFKVLTTLAAIKDQPEKLLAMKASGWDWRSETIFNSNVENFTVSQRTARSLELQWSNLQMEQHCIGGYVIRLKKKNEEKGQNRFFKHNESTVSYLTNIFTMGSVTGFFVRSYLLLNRWTNQKMLL